MKDKQDFSRRAFLRQAGAISPVIPSSFIITFTIVFIGLWYSDGRNEIS
jgi:hypothetical protein